MIERIKLKFNIKLKPNERYPAIIIAVSQRHAAQVACEEMLLNDYGFRSAFVGEVTAHRTDGRVKGDGDFQCVALGEDYGPQFNVSLKKGTAR